MIINDNYEYAGFWVRVGAAIIDTIIMFMVITPILFFIYGDAYFGDQMSTSSPIRIVTDWIFPMVASILFWVYKSATPGKSLLSLKVLDANTGRTLTVMQSFIRYIGYFISMIPLFLGLIWVGIDRKKQGFHDKIASTIVVVDKDSRGRGVDRVVFDEVE